MHYYENYLLMYLCADSKTREESRKHWIKCHKENIKSKSEDMIIFSAKILASIALADSIIADQIM